MKYLLLLLLAGCTQPLSNDEIIAETKKCREADMDALQFSNGASADRAFAVQCVNKASK